MLIDPERKERKEEKKEKKEKKKKKCEWAERKGEFGKGVSGKIHHVCVL